MKLTVATTFPVYPPQGGGQSRIFGLYRTLARHGVEVDVVALTGAGTAAGRAEVAPGLHEVRVPMTPAFAAAQADLERQVGVPVTDIAFSLHHDLVPGYADALAASAEGSSAVVASHPFTQPAIAELDVPRIYESHNVEADLKADMYPESEEGRALAAAVADVERAACASDLVIACASADAVRLGELYGIDPGAVAVVANGIDPSDVDFVPPEQRRALKAALGLDGVYQAVFIGSRHEPNLVAIRDILAAAPQLPDVDFVIVGGAGEVFMGGDAPANVDLTGAVAGGFLRSLLRVADLALNPMRSGSGTNLKMLDYALAGLPILSTSIGARGLDLVPGRHYRPFEPDALAAAIPAARDEPLDIGAVREHVVARFSWDVIADGWLAHPGMRALLEGVPA